MLCPFRVVVSFSPLNNPPRDYLHLLAIPVVSAATSARPFPLQKGRADVAALTTGIDRRVYL